MAAHVYLTDFGLAKVVTGQAMGLSRLTQTGTTLGTPAYMSPEQARGELAELTAASDVWALGCVLYECLAGRKAFEGETPAAVIGAVLTQAPGPLPDPWSPVADILHRCLAKAPRARYQHARELEIQLFRLIALPPRKIHRERQWRRLRRYVGFALGAAVAVGVGVWSTGRPAATPSVPEVAPPDPERARAEALATRAWQLRGTDLPQACTLFTQALGIAPERHDWRVDLGLLWWAGGNVARAAEAWRAVPEGDRSRTRARWILGLALYTETLELNGGGRPPQEVFDAWGEAAQGAGPSASLAQAGLRLERRRYAEARQLVTEVAGWESALLRGLIETSVVGEPPDVRAGLAGYDVALRDGIPFAWAFVNRGALHSAGGDAAAAEADFDEAVRRRPDSAAALYNRGSQRMLRRDREGALEDFNAALAIAPRMMQALVGRARLRHLMHDSAGALEDLAVAAEVAPTTARVFAVRSTIYLTMRRPEEAMADAQRATQLDPTSAEAHLALGGARIIHRDVAGAAAAFRNVLELEPDDQTRATASRLLAECEKALRQLQGR